MANSYFEKRLKDYENSTNSLLDNFENEFVNVLDCQTQKNNNLFKSFENKLLPLHGHPNNKDLLFDLEEEVIEKTSVLGLKWDDVIIKYKVRKDKKKKFYLRVI